MRSIAVSVTIRPSRTLLLLVLGMAALSFSFCVFVAVGTAVNDSPVSRTVVASLCIGSPLVTLISLVRKRKTLRIDISGIGQIRLLEYTEVAPASDERQSIELTRGEEYRMKDGSTLWPGLLLLHLESSEGRRQTVQVLPDSVTPDEFRSLYIALRWISVRKETGEKYF